MKYDINIVEHNVKPHLDIERDIQRKKNGLVTFNLRISQGNIEDYAQYETITISNYPGFTITTFEEFTITRHVGNGSKEDAVRPDDRKRGSEERGG